MMTQKDRDALDDWLKTAKGPFVLDAHVPRFGRSHTSHPVTREDILNAAREFRAQYPLAKISFAVRSSCVTPLASFQWSEEAAPEPKTLDQWIKALKGTFIAYVYRGDARVSSTHYDCKYADAASFLDRMISHKELPPTKFLLEDSENANNVFEYVVEGKKDTMWDGTVASLDKAIIEKALDLKKKCDTLGGWLSVAQGPFEVWATDVDLGASGRANLDHNQVRDVVSDLKREGYKKFWVRDSFGDDYRWTEAESEEATVSAEITTIQTTKHKTLEEWMAQIKQPKVMIKGLDKNGTEVFREDYDSHKPGSKVREIMQHNLNADVSPLRLPLKMTAFDGRSVPFMWDITGLSKDHPCWDLVAPTAPKPPSPVLATTPPPPVDRGPSVVQEPDLYEGEPDYDKQDDDTQDDDSIEPGDLVVHALSGTRGRVVQFVPDHEIRARTLDTAHEARVSVPAWAVDTKDGLKIYPEGSLEVVDETWGQTAWALMGFVGGALVATVFWVLVTGVLWR